MDDKFDRDVNPDFIEVIDGLFSKDFCDNLIKLIDKHEEMGLTRTRKGFEGDGDATKSDTFMFLGREPELNHRELEEKLGENWEDVIEKNRVCNWSPQYENKFNRIFWGKAYPEYLKKYNILSSLPRHINDVVKLQKTRPTEGYHVWHSEHGASSESVKQSNRILVWMLYLNDEFEAGETEFLYQAKRVKPKTGRLVIWPAGFTHTHRGNPPIGGTKYAATGWIIYKGHWTDEEN